MKYEREGIGITIFNKQKKKHHIAASTTYTIYLFHTGTDNWKMQFILLLKEDEYSAQCKE